MKTEYTSELYDQAHKTAKGSQLFETAERTLSSKAIEKAKEKLREIELGDLNEALKECDKALKIAIHYANLQELFAPSSEYLIIERLRDFINGLKNSSTGLEKHKSKRNSNVDWNGATNYAAQLKAAENRVLPGSPTLGRSWHASVCAILLNKKGIDIIFKDGLYIFTENGLNSAQELLLNKIKKIGGINVLKHMFSTNSKNYHRLARRNIHIPECAKHPIGIQRKATPWNMILNLCLLELTHKKSGRHEFEREVERRELSELTELSQLIAGAIDVEPHSQFELVDVPSEQLASKLIDASLYTNIYEFIQMDERLALSIVDKVEKLYGELQVESTTISRICSFGRWIIGLCSETDITHKRFKHFRKECRSAGFIEAQTLISLFSSSNGMVNNGFMLPSSGSEYFMNPLLHTKNNKICMLSKPITANATIEKVFALMRSTELGNNFNSAFGRHGLESILAEVHHNTHNIQIIQGKIINSKYETDGILETENDIHIFELKMKSLIQKTRGGDDVSIIRDLVKSLLYTQSQAMDIEHEIKSRGYIDIQNDSNEFKRIVLKGRTIRRRSIVLFDYGSLQQAQLVSSFLGTLLSSDFHHESEDQEKILSQLRSEVERFRKSFRKLHDADFNPKVPFHYCSFLSLSDIFSMLNISKSKSDYFNLVNRIDSILVGTAPPLVSALKFHEINSYQYSQDRESLKTDASAN